MKRNFTSILSIFFVLATSPLAAKEPQTPPPPAQPPQKVVTAVRAQEPFQIDAYLKEKAWQGPSTQDFIQQDPVDGGTPSEKTEVWVAYDDENIYIAALLQDSEPGKIRSLLGRRDDQVESDWFVVALDPYYDRRTGYAFWINPAGSILDRILFNDVDLDDSWDGIWEGKTRVHEKGWTVEIRIPLNQLRFQAKEEQVWGVNFRRVIKRKNENLSYVWIRKDETANVSRFARLEGIRNIKPGRNVELIPYSVGQAQFKPAEQGNPFETGRKMLGNAGLDFKVGLKSNLTLSATINPDFGQVEVDPAVLNLSAYETYYSEKRPFFIEGAQIFNGFGQGGVFLNLSLDWPGPDLFYSRRIGRAPQGYVTSDGCSSSPDRTTILGAAKITGRLGGGWNFGLIQALTASEFAQIDDSGLRLRQQVEPFSAYGVVRLQKDFNEGRQGLGFIATGVGRNLDDQFLSNILNKTAFSLGIDGWSYLDQKRNWVVGGWLAGTRIAGSTQDILRLQRSSMHYYQRPGAPQVELDPAATSLSGWAGHFSLAKQQGSWMFLFSLGALSPGFNPNDMGFQGSGSDKINGLIVAIRQWTKPGKVFRRFAVYTGPYLSYDFGGTRTNGGNHLYLSGQFLNYWGFSVFVLHTPPHLNWTLTRGGPLTKIKDNFEMSYSLWSDDRKAVVLEGYGYFGRTVDTMNDWSVGFYLRWKPGSNISFSWGPSYERYTTETQWVTRVPDPLAISTFGSRYVFGHLNEHVFANEFRLNWIFTPRLSLQLYLQPFLAVGRFDRFKELAKPRTAEYNIYGQGASTVSYQDGLYTVEPDTAQGAAPFSFSDPDFNFKSLRGTAVLRWEYRPGSLIYLVWTQNRSDYGHPGDFRLRRDLGDLFTAPGDNILLLKFSYRWSL